MDPPLDRWTRQSWGWRGGEVPAEAVSSRVTQLLRRLAGPAASGTPETAGAPAGRLSAVFRPPATHDIVADTELRLAAALPEDYLFFLLRSDGASLFDAGSPGRRSMELFGTSELVRVAEEAAGGRPTSCAPELLVFASIGSDGDRLAFDTGRVNPRRGCAVLDARSGHRPDQWWVINRDFTDWLDRLLTDPGPPGSFGRHWEPALLQPTLPLLDLPDPSPDRLKAR